MMFITNADPAREANRAESLARSPAIDYAHFRRVAAVERHIALARLGAAVSRWFRPAPGPLEICGPLAQGGK